MKKFVSFVLAIATRPSPILCHRGYMITPNMLEDKIHKSNRIKGDTRLACTHEVCQDHAEAQRNYLVWLDATRLVAAGCGAGESSLTSLMANHNAAAAAAELPSQAKMRS